MNELSELQKKLGYRFSDIDLLKRALTHSSYANEIGLERIYSNERLEFLGDALLEMMVSLILFRQKPVLAEGEMTRIRAGLVCESSLSILAAKFDLGSYLLLGRGEDHSGGRKRPSILADACEAVIAAIYLDGGIEPAMQFVTDAFISDINKPAGTTADYKTLLQEIIQEKPGLSYCYKTISETGPDHNKTFTVEILIGGKPSGTGTGKSKKAAEQEAAREAILLLKKR